MIRVSSMLFALLMLSPLAVHATTYYISPTGSNNDNGLTASTPWLTFAHAMINTVCGDTLTLVDGTYGDGTSTGKLAISGRVCTASTPFTVRALNSRQATIKDNGTGSAIFINAGSSHIIFDGIVAKSTNNGTVPNASTSCSVGLPFNANGNSPTTNAANVVNFLTIKNSVFYNPNKYCNVHVINLQKVFDGLIEDTELYDFHRHAMNWFVSKRIVGRRVYAHSRSGIISGGYSTAGGVGASATLASFYPCTDCILENSVGENIGGLFEMNASNNNGIAMSGSQVLGSICLNCGWGGNGGYPNARTAPGDQYSPTNITIRNMVLYNFGTNGPGGGNAIRAWSTVNATFDRNTLVLDGAARGFFLEDVANGAAVTSITVTNNVVVGGSTAAYYQSGYTTWSGSNNSAFSATTSYTPALPSNWSTPTASVVADPQLGTCIAWRPDGSAAKTADRGAEILYRYVDGVLTTTPLWDVTTGEFPHGATVTGVNDVAGSSLFDTHTRLKINTGGCSFPAGYGGGPPSNPSHVVISTNLSGAHVHAIDAGMDSLTVAVQVRHDGLNVSYATGLVSSCGNQTIPVILSHLETITNDLSQTLFGKINPNPGTCTLTPSFSGSNISGWTMISVEKENVASYNGTAVGGASDNSFATVIVPTNQDELVLAFLATSNAVTASPGTNQINNVEQIHPSVVLRGATSEKAGVNGGQMSWTLGGSVGWVAQGVSLIPPGGSGGNGSTFRVSRYRIDGLLGTGGAPEVTLGALGTQDQPAQVSTTGAFRVRSEIIIETAASAAVEISLYCRKNSGTYYKIGNAFGSSVVRYYGPGVDSNIPAHGTATTQRFSGTFTAGKTIRDGDASTVLNSINTNTRTELDFQLVLGNGAAAGDIVECEVRRGDGSTLGTHTVLPTIAVINGQASMGF